MKKYILYFLIIILPTISGCYKTSEEMGGDNNAVILAYPSAKNYTVASSGLNFWNKALLNFDMSRESVDIKVSVNLAQPVTSNASFTLSVDEEAYNAYNDDTSNATKYALMPQEYYEIPDPQVTLLSGRMDTTIVVRFFPSKFDISATGYLLPVTIQSTGSQAVHAEMRTVYFHIEKDPFPPYGTSGWTVTGFSSEEATGEGPNNGRVVHLIDNNPSTFWHSQWQGGVPGPPHWFSFDMGEAKPLHGIMLLARQCGCSNRPKNVTISISEDNVTWTNVADLTLANGTSWQKFSFGNTTSAVRYFKVTINGMYDAQTYTNLAEVKAF